MKEGKRIIKDVWSGLELAKSNFIGLMLILWLILPAIGLFFKIKFLSPYSFDIVFKSYIVLSVFIFFQSILIYYNNSEYIIDETNGEITIPKSDVENSLSEIILGTRYFNLLKRKIIKMREIENIYLDTHRWTTENKVFNGTRQDGKAKYRTETVHHVLYTINITGSFGSENLSFTTRQKRDELRNAISQSVRKVTGRNVDRKVAEFN
jgi:hypothetical protein